MTILSSEEEQAIGDLVRALGSEVEPLTEIIGRLEAEIARGPDPAKYVTRRAMDRATARADAAERDLAEQLRLLRGAAERASALEQAFTERIEVVVRDEPDEWTLPAIRMHHESRRERRFSVGVEFMVSIDALRDARYSIKQWVGERIFHDLVDRVRVELSEHFGPIRDPFAGCGNGVAPDWIADIDAQIDMALAKGAKRNQLRVEVSADVMEELEVSKVAPLEYLTPDIGTRSAHFKGLPIVGQRAGTGIAVVVARLARS